MTQKAKHTDIPYRVMSVKGDMYLYHFEGAVEGNPIRYIAKCPAVDEEAVVTMEFLARSANFHYDMLRELKAIGHQTTITTEHFNRIQRLISSIEGE